MMEHIVIWCFVRLAFVFFGVMLFTIGCGGEESSLQGTAIPEMTRVPTATPTERPAATPTEIPTVTQVATPTVAYTATPTNTPRPVRQITFEWSPEGVRPADSDDVDAIILEISNNEGVLSGFGNEVGITIQYDPTIITLEEIMEILEHIGHPVIMRE